MRSRKIEYRKVSTEKINRKKINQKHQKITKKIINKQYCNQDTVNKCPTCNHSESEVRVKNQLTKSKPGHIFMIMNFNRKFICFKELLAEELSNSNSSIVVMPYGNLNKARNILQQITNPSKVLLHIGINNIFTQRTLRTI